jgi:hypothetical protein
MASFFNVVRLDFRASQKQLPTAYIVTLRRLEWNPKGGGYICCVGEAAGSPKAAGYCIRYHVALRPLEWNPKRGGYICRLGEGAGSPKSAGYCIRCHATSR